MGRLIDWPERVGIRTHSALAGPRAIGAGASESLSGWVQTTAGAFGLWRWQIGIAPMIGEPFRRYRGAVTALHGGANAVRVTFYDPDGLHLYRYAPWSNGQPWSNGANWAVLHETVPAETAAKGATEIHLVDENWGHQLGMGDWIGFSPSHFGLYTVTQVFESGHYRIWPPLRKAVAAGSPGDQATLLPVLAMRLESEAAANVDRGLESADGATMTLLEVAHEDVIEYFAE